MAAASATMVEIPMSGEGGPPGGRVMLEENEVAIILRDDDDDVLTRLVFGAAPRSDVEVPYAVQLAVALLTRLQEDQEFHQEILEWFESYSSDNEDDGEDDEDDGQVRR
jgi:hypothetical protein